MIAELSAASARVSLFIEADQKQLEAAVSLRAPVVELHAGAYCDACFDGDGATAGLELERLQEAATAGAKMGLEVHVGHGLTFDTVAPVAAMPEVKELNIGHFLVGEAIFIGLEASIKRMRALMDKARAETLNA